MNLAIKGIIITMMKLKLSLITQSIAAAMLLLAQTAYAAAATPPAISGKPYNNGTLNTNIPANEINLPD